MTNVRLCQQLWNTPADTVHRAVRVVIRDQTCTSGSHRFANTEARTAFTFGVFDWWTGQRLSPKAAKPTSIVWLTHCHPQTGVANRKLLGAEREVRISRRTKSNYSVLFLPGKTPDRLHPGNWQVFILLHQQYRLLSLSKHGFQVTFTDNGLHVLEKPVN